MVIDFAIIGAQKAGTTSLKSYLAQLDGVVTHPDRECPYFLAKEYREEPLKDRFPEPGEGDRILMKHVGLMDNPAAMERLKAHSPGVRVILLVREPVARAISAHRYAVRRGWEDRGELLNCLGSPNRIAGSYIDRGRYELWIPRVEAIFGAEHLYVDSLERLQAQPRLVMRLLCEWMGLVYEELDFKIRHNTAREARSQVINRILQAPFPLRRRLSRLVPPVTRSRLRGWMQRLNERKPVRAPAADSLLEQSLRKEFSGTYLFMRERYPELMKSWRTE